MVLKLKKCNTIDGFFALGADKHTVFDAISAFLLAISPLLQHYRGVYRNAGFTVLLLVFPFILLRFGLVLRSGAMNRHCFYAVLPLIIFELYSIISHPSSIGSIVYSGFMLLIFLFIAAGAVNCRCIFRYSVFIAKVASILIIIQTLTWYLIGYHIRLIPVNLLLEGSDIWINRSVIGVTRIGEMYRPSSIFLEPSHFFLYTFPLLCILLLLPEINSNRMKDSIILSLAILLTTSGFGILFMVMLWGVYLVFYRKQENRKMILARIFSLRTIIVTIVLTFLVVFAYLYIPLVRNTITRIFDFQTGSSIAINGRIRLANNFLSGLSGKSLLFGVTTRNDGFDFNMAGFHSTLYKWGIIGLFLTYYFYGQGLIKLHGAYFYMTFIILVVSFFRHIHTVLFI